jgi:hypothetical protein
VFNSLPPPRPYRPTHPRLSSRCVQGNQEWCGIILFFIFNIFDTIGRYLPGYIRLYNESGLMVGAWVHPLAPSPLAGSGVAFFLFAPSLSTPFLGRACWPVRFPPSSSPPPHPTLVVVCLLSCPTCAASRTCVVGMVLPLLCIWQVVTLLRFGLVPIWILCVRGHHVFGNDLFVAALMVVFSFTNGYNASLGMMYGPRKVRSKCSCFVPVSLKTLLCPPTPCNVVSLSSLLFVCCR